MLGIRLVWGPSLILFFCLFVVFFWQGRWAVIGVVLGLILGFSSMVSKWEEVQRLSGRAQFHFLICSNFKEARLVGDEITVRLKHHCPALSAFTSFGSLDLRDDFEWSAPDLNLLKWSDLNSIHFYLVRSRLSNWLSNQWPIQSALRRALFLGDGSELPRRFWSLFNKLGLSHLLVASGMHLVWFGLFLSKALSILLRSFIPPSRVSLWLFRSLLMLGMSIFAILLGFDLSVSRAWLVWTFCVLASWLVPLGGRLSAEQILAACGISFLVWNPVVVFDASYALSFGTSWILIRTGSVVLTSGGASIICGLYGLTSSLLATVFNVILAAPLMLFLAAAALAPGLEGRVEALLLDLMRLLSMVADWGPSFSLPDWGYSLLGMGLGVYCLRHPKD